MRGVSIADLSTVAKIIRVLEIGDFSFLRGVSDSRANFRTSKQKVTISRLCVRESLLEDFSSRLSFCSSSENGSSLEDNFIASLDRLITIATEIKTFLGISSNKITQDYFRRLRVVRLHYVRVRVAGVFLIPRKELSKILLATQLAGDKNIPDFSTVAFLKVTNFSNRNINPPQKRT